MNRYYVSPCDYEGVRSWCVMRRHPALARRYLVSRDALDVAVSEHDKRAEARKECAQLNAEQKSKKG